MKVRSMLSLCILESFKRLDVGLYEILGVFLQANRSQISHLIESNLVYVNGKVAKKSKILNRGDVIEIYKIDSKNMESKCEDSKQNQLDSIEIIAQSDEYIVFNKPRGLVVHEAPSVNAPTLTQYLRANGYTLSNLAGESRQGIVHRLDKDTSGAILVAKSNRAHAYFSDMLKERKMGRIYLCVISPPLRENLDSKNLENLQMQNKDAFILPQHDESLLQNLDSKKFTESAIPPPNPPTKGGAIATTSSTENIDSKDKSVILSFCEAKYLNGNKQNIESTKSQINTSQTLSMMNKIDSIKITESNTQDSKLPLFFIAYPQNPTAPTLIGNAIKESSNLESAQNQKDFKETQNLDSKKFTESAIPPPKGGAIATIDSIKNIDSKDKSVILSFCEAKYLNGNKQNTESTNAKLDTSQTLSITNEIDSKIQDFIESTNHKKDTLPFDSQKILNHDDLNLENLNPIIVSCYMGRNPHNRLKMTKLDKNRFPKARDSKSEFRKIMLSDDGKYELVSVRLFSGRTHQIRVHLESMQRYIYGDRLYSPKSMAKDYKTKMLLHAKILYFDDNVFIAKMPKDLIQFLTKNFSGYEEILKAHLDSLIQNLKS